MALASLVHGELGNKLDFVLRNFVESDSGFFAFPDGDVWKCRRAARGGSPAGEREVHGALVLALDAMQWKLIGHDYSRMSLGERLEVIRAAREDAQRVFNGDGPT
jgi:hypothetical protein